MGLNHVSQNVKRSSRFQVVVKPRGSEVNFVGTNYSGEAAVPQLCTYALGVLDKDTQTLKIVPITSNKMGSHTLSKVSEVLGMLYPAMVSTYQMGLDYSLQNEMRTMSTLLLLKCMNGPEPM
ncbi:hypothetical protein POM88_000844 [Heracleum sosnowskyi]|uniref:Uncharacterized protein n=1 Tax=Heracleum sosnowskyi TaxID=360622 RepID=A0AAD8N934_9APIA|nr:hypothetical protein POM88_000844 [Heracleum sosnowskyi]